MEVFQKKTALTDYIAGMKGDSQRIGFVPTMGALHEGHLSLIRRATEENDSTVCSIFVNPTQFDDPSDLQQYPRQLKEDIHTLEKEGVDVVFTPSRTEMYPSGLEEEVPYEFGHLSRVMEGKYREGHFQGVAQIVAKLLEAVRPHYLYLGQKDYQQYLIVRSLIRQMKVDVETVLCPIIREEDGLAVSSRNVRLTKEERRQAPQIYETLLYCKRLLGEKPVRKLKKEALQRLGKVPTFKEIDYFEIVDAEQLKVIDSLKKTQDIIACAAVRLENVRLIDNMFLKRSPK